MRIVDIVRPHMTTQDSNFRPATPVEKKVEAALGRLATGECYRSNIRYGGIFRRNLYTTILRYSFCINEWIYKIPPPPPF